MYVERSAEYSKVRFLAGAVIQPRLTVSLQGETSQYRRSDATKNMQLTTHPESSRNASNVAYPISSERIGESHRTANKGKGPLVSARFLFEQGGLSSR